MNKCLRIFCTAEPIGDILRSFIQEHARKLGLEGTAQVVEGQIKIMVCGKKDDIDVFIDILHAGNNKFSLSEIEIEPFFKEKDYRGVFRVIE